LVQTKLFSDLYLAQFLDNSAKSSRVRQLTMNIFTINY